MAQNSAAIRTEERRARGYRLGFRVDAETKKQVEQAAALERRSLTDFCLTAIAGASQKTIARHKTLVLSNRDREVFFNALVHPPKPNVRMRRAFKLAEERVVSR